MYFHNKLRGVQRKLPCNSFLHPEFLIDDNEREKEYKPIVYIFSFLLLVTLSNIHSNADTVEISIESKANIQLHFIAM